ncbi:DUF4052 family protein [Bacillus sp. FSL K6-6038]
MALLLGGAIFLGLTSVLYGEVGIKGLVFKNSATLIDIPYFIMISID